MLRLGDIAASNRTGLRYIVTDASDANYVTVRLSLKSSIMPTRRLKRSDLIERDTGRLTPATVTFNKLMERLRYGDLYR